jgi:hypothetical protein
MKTTKQIEIPITARARTYGYIIWGKKQAEAMDLFIGNSETVDITTADNVQKAKRVDRKQKRISLGYRFTNSIDKKHNVFVLTSVKPGRVILSTR